MCSVLLGEDSGDLTSGLGATGCTGLVCLAASFFRLTRLFSNISCTELCFWKTFSIWSWLDKRHSQGHDLGELRRSFESIFFFCRFSADPELSREHRLVLAEDAAAVGERVRRRRVQVALQLLQRRLGPLLGLAAVYGLAGQQEDALFAPVRCLEKRESTTTERFLKRRGRQSMASPAPTPPHPTYLLQGVVELHGSEQQALLAPQGGADVLAGRPQLAALWPDGVLGVVGALNQLVALAGQGQRAVQHVLSEHRTRNKLRPECFRITLRWL